MTDDLKKFISERLLNDRNQVLEQVRKSIRADNAALVFGAGVSKPAELPAWTGLISCMMGYAVQRDALKSDLHTDAERDSLLRISELLIHSKLELLGNVNPLESAEYVVQFFGDENLHGLLATDELRELAVKSMVKKLIDASLTPEQILKKIYALKSPPFLKGVCTDLDAGVPTAQAVMGIHPQIASLNTLFAASYLMARDTNGIRRAITYNYDPLIQEQLLTLYGLKPDAVFTHAGKWRGRPATHARELFHVHGYISGTRHCEAGLENVYPTDSGRIILSEDSYYVLEREEAYNWSSSIQSTFLNRYHCIFVGFSAEDFNFRRILRQMGQRQRNDRAHYLILSVDNLIKATNKAADEARTNGEVLSDEDIVPLIDRLLHCREQYWVRFGIHPIFAIREEIPDILLSL